MGAGGASAWGGPGLRRVLHDESPWSSSEVCEACEAHPGHREPWEVREALAQDVVIGGRADMTGTGR